MRILITGGAGFIGSYFTKVVAMGENANYYSKVTVIDDLTYAGNISNLSEVRNYSQFNFIKGNICSLDLVNDLVSDHDVIVNFAAESHVDRSLLDPTSFINTNYVGVFNILSAMKKYKGKKLIQVSTDEVYGQIQSGSWTESQSLDPRSPYSATKAAADLLVLSYFNSYGLDVCITRASNNFGLRQHPEKLIPKTIIKAITGCEIPIYGNGKNIRDWLFVGDHVDGIEKVIHRGISGNIYNFGGDNELTNIDLVKHILDLLNIDYEKIKFINDRPGHDLRYSLSSGKSKRELGFMPSLNFNTRIKETIDWYQNNESWWAPLVVEKF
jgi:dTDP-glucose 4,6-dehydratase